MADATAGEAAAPSHHPKVGMLGAAALVAGSMIGSGVYLLPATMGAIGSISILGWLVATLAALAISGVFVWLSSEVVGAEGVPGYVQAGLGPFLGAQAAVLFWTSCWAGAVAIALAAAGAAGFLVPALAEPGPRLATTIAIIWAAVGLCWLGPRVVARAEGLTLGLGLLPVILAATAGWFFFKSDVFLASWNPGGLSLDKAVGASALNAFWAFLGMECAAAAAGVVRDPTRNVPRATILGVLGAAALYIGATSAIMGILPASLLAKSDAPFGDAARAALGAAVGAGIAACAFLRTAGCVTGWTLVVAETSRGAADQGVFPKVFRTRPGERSSPVNLVVGGALMTVFALTTANPSLAKQFSTIINACSLLSIYTYTLAALSLARIAMQFSPGRRAAALANTAVAIAFAALLVSGAKPIELGLSLIPIPVAALLYLWLRRG